MVEMLGVLAVIGVLSVGGIYGYRIAMTQHKANQIWRDVMTAATLIRGVPEYNSGSDEVAGEVEFSSLENAGVSGDAIEGEIKGILERTKGSFQIKVSGIPQDVCQKVIQMRPNEMLAIFPNGENSISCVNGNNIMWFLFDASQACASRCESWYEDWKNNCGSNWSECNPSLGFFCYQDGAEASRCNDGLQFWCNGFHYNADASKWEAQGADNILCQ